MSKQQPKQSYHLDLSLYGNRIHCKGDEVYQDEEGVNFGGVLCNDGTIKFNLNSDEQFGDEYNFTVSSDDIDKLYEFVSLAKDLKDKYYNSINNK